MEIWGRLAEYFQFYRCGCTSIFPEAADTPEIECTGTVLLVDDDTMLLMVTGAMLSMLGFKVLSAMDDIEAAEVFREHRAKSVSC